MGLISDLLTSLLFIYRPYALEKNKKILIPTNDPLVHAIDTRASIATIGDKIVLIIFYLYAGLHSIQYCTFWGCLVCRSWCKSAALKSAVLLWHNQFLPNPHKWHPIAHLRGWDMVCLVGTNSYLCCTSVTAMLYAMLCNMMTSSNGNIFRVTGLCAGNSPVNGEFPTQRLVMWSFDVFFDLSLNKWLSKQSWGWWFETPSRSLWCHRNDIDGLV